MRSDEDVRVHRFVQATFLQNRCVRIDGCCIHPFFGLLCIVEEKRDLHVFPAFGTVPKNHGKRLNSGVLAVALDEFVQHGFCVMPLTGVHQAE